MNEPRPLTEEPEAVTGEDLYLRWHEWVAINLGRDARRASIAARAATNAALQGAGFDSAIDAARRAWLSDTASPAPPPDPQVAARPARWTGPVGIAAPLVIEAVAFASLFLPNQAGWFLGLLFLGVPFAYAVAAAVLAGKSVPIYAAIAVALVPGSAVLNGLLLLSICQAEFANAQGGTLP